MSRTTNGADDADELSAIELTDLLSPTAKAIWQGQIDKDAGYSVFCLAREALGWQSWARENNLPLAGNPIVITHQTARELGVSIAQTNGILEQLQAQGCVPAAKFKEGDAACWMKIAQLDLDLYKSRCPASLQPEVERRINDYRSDNPKPQQQRQSAETQAPEATTTGYSTSAKAAAPTAEAAEPISSSPGARNSKPKSTGFSPAPDRPATPEAVPGIKVEVEQPGVRSQPQQRMDRDFANLGRQIVQMAGHEKDGKLAFQGKVNYKIVVNLDTNTMKIYSKDRGDEPILVDANGNIDHPNSRVIPQDVEKFKSALKFLQQDHEKKVAAYER